MVAASGTRKAEASGPRLLSIIGAINWDVSIFEERFARAGEEVPVGRVEEFSGGKAANVAVAAAKLLGRGRVACLGALGDDEVGKAQLAELEAEGVVVDGIVEVAGCRSGKAYILIDADGRKTIHTLFGANSRIAPGHIRRGGCADVISRTGTMVVMDPPTPVALVAARAAKRNGARLVYSPGVRTQEGVGALEPIMGITDILVVDRIELMNLRAVQKDGDERAVMAALCEGHPGMTVVATLGAAGCAVASSGSVSSVSGVEASTLGGEVKNTTGCGDAFLGVFAGRIVLGDTPLRSAAWANLAGALKALRVETRGSPTRRELEAAFRSVAARPGALGSARGAS
ncbi:MAG: carbohydrate kinase family protein [Nitrososphaerales archaeon]